MADPNPNPPPPGAARRLRFAPDIGRSTYIIGSVPTQRSAEERRPLRRAAVVPNSAPLATETPNALLQHFKKVQTDRFAEWRRGNYDYDAATRVAELDGLTHPTGSTWQLGDRIEEEDNDDPRMPPFARPVPVGDPNAPQTPVSRAANMRLLGALNASGFDIVELMGRDGNQLIYRFGMRLDDQINVVVKVDVTDGAMGSTFEERNTLVVSAESAKF